MSGISTRAFLATGLAFLVTSVLLGAAFFGLLPDRAGALRHGRTALAELAALITEPGRDPRSRIGAEAARLERHGCA